jgi:hypothetical protein
MEFPPEQSVTKKIANQNERCYIINIKLPYSWTLAHSPTLSTLIKVIIN